MAGEVRVQPTPEESGENIQGAFYGLSDYVLWNGEVWETWDLAGNCSLYNLSPNGELFLIYTNESSDYEMVGQDDPRYDEKHPWKNWNIIPNGVHGRVSPVIYTGWVNLVPRWLEDRPNTKLIQFVEGKSQG